MLLLHANYDGFLHSQWLVSWSRSIRNGRVYRYNLQFTRGGGGFRTWETTYNLVQTLMKMKIQNWEYGSRVISIRWSFLCVFSWITWAWCCQKKYGIPVTRRRRECVVSFSQRCRTQCSDRTGFLFARKNNLRSRALVHARDILFIWEINIEMCHG